MIVTTKSQGELEGFEAPSIKALDECAIAFMEARDARMEMAETEKHRKAELVTCLEAHAEEIGQDESGGISYRFRDGELVYIAKLAPEDVKCSVRREKQSPLEVAD